MKANLDAYAPGASPAAPHAAEELLAALSPHL
jgi:hypothetical protein